MAKKAVTDKKGVLIYIDMTPQEEMEYLANNNPIWHDENRHIQVIISEYIKRELLVLNQEHDILGNHPDVAMLLAYVKTISASSVNEDGNLYIYLNEIYPEHKAFLESFGIQINHKS